MSNLIILLYAGAQIWLIAVALTLVIATVYGVLRYREGFTRRIPIARWHVVLAAIAVWSFYNVL